MNRIIIYGFGGLGEKFFNYIINKNFQIISILDKGKKAARMIPVRPADQEAINSLIRQYKKRKK